MNTARREMEAYVAEQRICTALQSRLPPATKFALKLGQDVRVYREEHRKWVGPYKIDRITDKMIYVTDGKVTKPFNVTQVIPAGNTNKDTDWKNTLAEMEAMTDNNFALIYFVEILRSGDPRFHTPDCQQEILKELNGLRECKVLS